MAAAITEPTTTMRFKAKRIFVTGASSAIGAATAMSIAREGGTVLASGRRPDALQRLVQSLPGTGHVPIAADATIEDEVAAATREAAISDQSLHGIVFCAGAHALRPVRQSSPKHYQDMFEQNVLAATNFMPALLRKVADGASIVLISSAAKTRGGTAAGAYVAAKSAVVGLVRAWACELAPRIRVNSISPGVVRTPMTSRFLDSVGAEAAAKIEKRHLLGLGEPQQIAHAILFLLSNEASWITGIDMAVDGGFSIQA